MSTSITFRIPEDLKKKMDQVKSVNWSEVVRRAITERLRIEEKLGTKNWGLIGRACRKQDDVRDGLEKVCGKTDYDSAETIRNRRDARLWKEQ
jgi:Arc/MetJ-type ribon-helix-helix transcriptional regulator